MKLTCIETTNAITKYVYALNIPYGELSNELLKTIKLTYILVLLAFVFVYVVLMVISHVRERIEHV